jgi:hypothetical protein
MCSLARPLGLTLPLIRTPKRRSPGVWEYHKPARATCGTTNVLPIGLHAPTSATQPGQITRMPGHPAAAVITEPAPGTPRVSPCPPKGRTADRRFWCPPGVELVGSPGPRR